MPTPPAAPTTLSLSQIVALLQRLPLFNGVSEPDLASLAAECRLDRFEADAAVFRQGDATERIYLLHQGRVKIVRQEADGREVILEIIPPGEIFGGGAIFLPEQPATAQAVAEAEVISFSSLAYTRFLHDHPMIALRVIRLLGARLHAALEMNALTGKRVEQRMAHILLKLAARAGRADAEGTLIGLSLSRQDLADLCGTTLETAIRCMSRFRADGLIKTRRGGYLVILDLDRLKHLSKRDTP